MVTENSESQTENDKKPASKLELWVKRTQLYANIIITLQIALIFIALNQYDEAKIFNRNQIETINRIESTKNAIEVINRIYTGEFLNSFSNLDQKSNLINEKDRSDFIIVLNNYYIAAVVYNSGIADTCLIRKSIENGVTKFIGLDIYHLFQNSSVQSAKDEIKKMTLTFKSKESL